MEVFATTLREIKSRHFLSSKDCEQAVAEPGLDLDTFSAFAPLLTACSEYARLNGYRFRGLSFEARSLEHLGTEWVEGDTVLSASGKAELECIGPAVAAELRASVAVREFTDRLQTGDAGLIAEVERAFDLMIAESVRNSMRGACRELELWPPEPKPFGIDPRDCSYHDCSVEMPVLAQRLFNDEARRLRIAEANDGVDEARKQAATASFLVDFAFEAGRRLPPMADAYALLLEEFSKRVEEYSDKRSGCTEEQFDGQGATEQETGFYTPSVSDDERDTEWVATSITEASSKFRRDLNRWLDKHYRAD